MSRLHGLMPAVGARFAWRTFWRHAREGAPARSALAASARTCLYERERAAEEAERQETQPGRAGYAFRNKSSIASRALSRRGWSISDMRDALKARGLYVDGGLVTLAVEVIRAERAKAGA